MPKATFFRMLETPIAEKGEHLRQQIAELNATRLAAQAFPTDPAAFAVIPGSPFAYWISKSARELFLTQPRFEQDGRVARVGDHPGDQERYLRLFWEVPAAHRSKNRRWVPYQKGGAYLPYYADIHLVVDWDFERETYFDFHGRVGRSSEQPSNYQFFFRQGLTWPRRTTSGISIRPLPKNCIFADKGPGAFVPDDAIEYLLALMAVMNSTPFLRLVELQLGAADVAARSYEVGIVQQTPIPANLNANDLSDLAISSHVLARQPFLSDETNHVFCLPALLRITGSRLAERLAAINQSETERQNALSGFQVQIDARVAKLYGVLELSESGLNTVEVGSEQVESTESTVSAETDEDSEDEAAPLLSSSYSLVADLLMWCVGVAFGRWDLRYALNPDRLPPLPEPFDPLPVCSPGMLQGADGLPLSMLPASYPLIPALHGFLVDDSDRPQDDIIAAVRRVLAVLLGENAEAIESEACQILGAPELRTWFRDPKGFFGSTA